MLILKKEHSTTPNKKEVIIIISSSSSTSSSIALKSCILIGWEPWATSLADLNQVNSHIHTCIKTKNENKRWEDNVIFNGF